MQGRSGPLIIGILATLVAAFSTAAADTILFVGNSFTYGAYSPVEHYRPGIVTDLNGTDVGGVPALFKAFTDEAGLHFDVSLETKGGVNFDFHLLERQPLIDRAWDHVVLQGYSTLDATTPGDATRFIDDSGKLAALFVSKNPAVDVRLTATWSRADLTYLPTGHWFGQPIGAMEHDIRVACDKALAASGHIRAVMPVGEAWNRAIDKRVATPNPYEGTHKGAIDLWAPDNYHASTYGYYLEALVIFGSVTGRDPRGLGAQESAARDLAIPEALAVELQRIAAETLDSEPRKGR